MTLVNIDIKNVASETHPDDRMVFYSPTLREAPGGGITSTAETVVPLVDGVGEIELVPGPVTVTFQCRGIADTRPKSGTVPDTGTVDIADVIGESFTYTAPVVSRALATINGAVGVAVAGEMGQAVRQATTSAMSAEQSAARANSRATSAEAKVDAYTPRVEALELMGGLVPGEPVDGQTANLVLQGDTLTGKAIGDVVQGKVVEAVTAPLAPLFLDPLPFGAQSGGPANLRAGLSPQHGPGGGWVEEMSVPVVGDAGATTLTSPDSATVDGFVTQRWQAAVSTGDRDFYVEVVGTDTGGVIHLRDPLPIDVEGYLSARYDTAPSGQHLTRRGTRAYVEGLLGISPVIAARGPILDGAWTDQPTRIQDLWRKNPALESAGVYQVTEGGPVVVGFMGTDARNSYDPDHGTPFSLGTQSHVSVGVGAAGQGLVADFDPAGRATVLSFGVGCQRNTHAPESFTVRIVVTADGVPILDVEDSGALRTYQTPINGVDRVTVEVTSASAIPHNIYVSETTLRLSGQDAPPQGRGKIVTIGDSWMAWYDGAFGKALAEKTGATVINHSLGGMTTEWGLAWWDEYVTKEKPDEVWIHFFTNDLNTLHTQTFVAPDGTTHPMWRTSDYAESRTLWRRNIWEMIRRAQAAGIRPVIIMPSATVSPTQTQNHMIAGCVLETPPLDATYQASAVEVANPEWVGNRRHKYIGKPLQMGSSTLFATGPDPDDAWENPMMEALLALQKMALSRSAYVTDATNFRQVTYGTTSASDVDTFSTTSPVTLDATWGSDGGGGRRIAGDVVIASGRVYLTVIRVAWQGALPASSLTGVPGALVTMSMAGATDGMPAGEALLIKRDTAGASTAAIYVGHDRVSVLPITTHTRIEVQEMCVVDVDALLRDVPNLAGATDRDLALFALDLT